MSSSLASGYTLLHRATHSRAPCGISLRPRGHLAPCPPRPPGPASLAGSSCKSLVNPLRKNPALGPASRTPTQAPSHLQSLPLPDSLPTSYAPASKEHPQVLTTGVCSCPLPGTRALAPLLVSPSPCRSRLSSPPSKKPAPLVRNSRHHLPMAHLGCGPPEEGTGAVLCLAVAPALNIAPSTQ